MAEHHRARIEFVVWDRGQPPWAKGFRVNPPPPVQGVWLRKWVRERLVLYRIGPGDVMTDAEAGAVLGVTRQTIRNWRLGGQIPAKRRKGTWYFAYADVRALHEKRGGPHRSIYMVG